MKLCITLNEKGHLTAWAEPHVIDEVLIPSLKDGIIIETEISDEELAFCSYINEELIYDALRKEEAELLNLRVLRCEEFNKYDKYQLPYVNASLTTEQINEYVAWRQAWLDAPQTKIIPVKPTWFESI